MNLIFIHGASSTPTSFNYLVQPFVKHQVGFFNYDAHLPLVQTVNKLRRWIDTFDKVSLVGHSLGGVIAIAAVLEPSIATCVDRIVTLSSPVGGVKSANYLRWFFPGYGLFNNIHTNSPVIEAIRTSKSNFTTRTASIVTTGGASPIIKEPNDGVVTEASQLALSNRGDNIRTEIFDLNHFEVLLSSEVRERVVKFLEEE